MPAIYKQMTGLIVVTVAACILLYFKSILVHLPPKLKYSHVVVWAEHPLDIDVFGGDDAFSSASNHRVFYNHSESPHSDIMYMFRHTPNVHVIDNGSMRRISPTEKRLMYVLHVRPTTKTGQATSSVVLTSEDEIPSEIDKLQKTGFSVVETTQKEVRCFDYRARCDKCKREFTFTREVVPKKLDSVL